MENFAVLSARTKLLISFGIIMILFLGVIFIARNSINNTTQSEKKLHDFHFTVAIQINELRSHQNHNRADILAMMLSKDKAEQLTLEKGINDRADTISQIIQNLSVLDTELTFKNNLKELKEYIDAYRLGREQEVALILEGKIEEASLLGTGAMMDRYNDIRMLSKKMSDLAQLDADSQLNADMKESNQFLFLLQLV